MSERILRALMQLFAIIAQVDEQDSTEENQSVSSSKSKSIVESFLRAEISEHLIKQYIDLFHEYLNAIHHKQSKKDGERKRTAVNSVKVLRICSQINEELTQKQKIIVLIRIYEFILTNDIVNDQENEFVDTVAEAFNIDANEYKNITEFVLRKLNDVTSKDEIIIVNSSKKAKENDIILDGLDAEIAVLHVKSVNLLFFRYFGKDDLNLNGQFIPSDRTHIFTQGATLRTQKSKSLYYSDVLSHFLKSNQGSKLSFIAENLTFQFKKGQFGLQSMNFKEESGNLIGIMGGSGAGKSTLLNIFNGNLTPSTGHVFINGIDLHKEKEKLQGIIGFISQDDLLIEELTVYQNLYFNAKLCFGNLSDLEIKKKVIDLLYTIGLYEAKDLVVGNPMQKIISGGQRKRLNIALELIREPEILFVDEPTSGLSSRDSENIMDLLKELTFKGKLVFVVIHQPNSDIFKQFDRLLIIDRGGFPVFDGNPIDAVVYFKQHVHHGNANERECAQCGNVNPELIFNILEMKVVDEYGNQTGERKTTPEEWYKKYNEQISINEVDEINEAPQIQTKIAGFFTQFKIFFLRDLLAKLSNLQYVLVTLLEAPLLALLLAYVVKFFDIDEDGNYVYLFYENFNIPQYIFIAVVVSIFLGLTVAAEEINKDKKILKRESFLNLSRFTYLTSKVFILIIISAIQSLLFIVVGNLILEIKGMWLEYWLVLFSTSCLANVLGLNISSAFDSAKVIYIIVPILIIPQLIFSGVIVNFNKLSPAFSKEFGVPLIGNLMPSRWSYEALAVAQSKNNELDRQFFNLNVEKNKAEWKKDYWYVEINKQLNKITDKKASSKAKMNAKEILINEIEKEEARWDNLKCEDCVNDLKKLSKNQYLKDKSRIEHFITILKNQATKDYTNAIDQIDQLKKKIGDKKYLQLKNDYANEALEDQVTCKTDLDKISIVNGQLMRTSTPIYYDDATISFFDYPFFSPYKYIFGNRIDTFWANILVIWLYLGIAFLTLYYDLLKKLIDYINYYLLKKIS